MNYDPYAAHQHINEQQQLVDSLKVQLATEKDLADQLQYALNELMKNYITRDLDPRTDAAITTALAAYRAQRPIYL